MKLTVTANVSYPLESKFHQKRVEIESVYQLFSHLRKSSFVSPGQDALAAIAFHLETGYNVIVKRAKWLPHGILFYIRALSKSSLENFMVHYHDKTFVHNVSQITLIDEVAETLRIPEAEVSAEVDPESYRSYTSLYMPIQGERLSKVNGIYIGFVYKRTSLIYGPSCEKTCFIMLLYNVLKSDSPFFFFFCSPVKTHAARCMAVGYLGPSHLITIMLSLSVDLLTL